MSEKQLSFYLAHPFESRKNIREWELKVENELGIELVNPFYDKEHASVVDIDAGRKDRYQVEPKDIVDPDILEIVKSDGVVAFVTHDISVGTFHEMVYAYINHKPLFLVVERDDDLKEHPWLRYHAHKIFDSRFQFEEHMKHMLAGTED